MMLTPPWLSAVRLCNRKKNPTPRQATLIANALRDRGFNVQVTGATTAGFRAEAPGMVRVIVPKSQLQDARAALAEHRDQVSDIDWSQVNVGDPE